MYYVDLTQVISLLNQIISLNYCILAVNCVTAFVTAFALIRIRKGVV